MKRDFDKVLVFKKFSNEVFWAIPFSTRIKKGRFYVAVSPSIRVPQVAIISQLRITDAKRLIRKIGVVSAQEYSDIQKATMNLCGS